MKSILWESFRVKNGSFTEIRASTVGTLSAPSIPSLESVSAETFDNIARTRSAPGPDVLCFGFNFGESRSAVRLRNESYVSLVVCLSSVLHRKPTALSTSSDLPARRTTPCWRCGALRLGGVERDSPKILSPFSRLVDCRQISEKPQRASSFFRECWFFLTFRQRERVSSKLRRQGRAEGKKENRQTSRQASELKKPSFFSN